MGQIIKRTSGGGGGTITTIVGDSGSVTGATVDLFANHGSANAGASVSFTAVSATEMDLVLSNVGLSSQYLGYQAGNATAAGGENCVLGVTSGHLLTSGGHNTIIGCLSGSAMTSAEDNVSLGSSVLGNLTTGANNIAIGVQSLMGLETGDSNIVIGGSSGSVYVGAESSNILISNDGVAAESNVIRIGTQGSADSEQDTCYIAGIVGVTVSNAVPVTIDSTTGQLGVGSGSSGITTIDGNSGSATGATVTISNTEGTPLFTNSGSSSSLTFTSTDAKYNTLIGSRTNFASVTGSGNTTLGDFTAHALTTGDFNTAIGNSSNASNISGNQNTTIGYQSGGGGLSAGDGNTFVGYNSGLNYTTSESWNIIIGGSYYGSGTIGESFTCRIGQGTGTNAGNLNQTFIAGIQGIAVTGAAVLISASDQLGVTVSSLKYKENVFPMKRESEKIFDLIPSVFTYKHDPEKQKKFGLIAEEVQDVMPELVIYDSKGEPQSVAYHDLPVLLLNEIQKLRREVDALKAR